MAVRFFYVDESHDDRKFCLSALAIRHSEWRIALDEVVKHRAVLRDDYGVFLTKEIHARDLVGGRGRLAHREVGKWERSRIFLSCLQLVARLPGVMVFNVCLDKRNHRDPQLIAWDRLLNRIERTMLEFENREIPKRQKLCAAVREHLSDADATAIETRLCIYRSRAVIVSDEGRELEIERALRKMHVLNYIPSRYGGWESGERSKNITGVRLDRWWRIRQT